MTSTCHVIGFASAIVAKRRRQRLDRIEHRAGEQEHEVEDRRDRVERVVAADRQREDRVEEEPAGRADDDRRGEQREAVRAQRHAEHRARRARR